MPGDNKWRTSTLDLEGEFEMTPKEMEGLFKHKNWAYDDGEGNLVTPDEGMITEMISTLVEDVSQDPDSPGMIRGRGRFLVYHDREHPGSYDVFLSVGYVWDNSLSEQEKKDLGVEDA